MITQFGLYWLATMGFLADYIGLSRATDYKTQAVALAFGFMFFAIFTMTSLGYYISSNAGVVSRFSSQALAVLGIVASAITLLLLFDVAFRAIKRAQNA